MRDDSIWHALFLASYPGLEPILSDGCAWYDGATWLERCASLRQHRLFHAQVAPWHLGSNSGSSRLTKDYSRSQAWPRRCSCKTHQASSHCVWPTIMSILCRCTTGSWRMTQRTSCCQVALLAQAIDINKPSYWHSTTLPDAQSPFLAQPTTRHASWRLEAQAVPHSRSDTCPWGAARAALSWRLVLPWSALGLHQSTAIPMQSGSALLPLSMR